MVKHTLRTFGIRVIHPADSTHRQTVIASCSSQTLKRNGARWVLEQQHETSQVSRPRISTLGMTEQSRD